MVSEADNSGNIDLELFKKIVTEQKKNSLVDNEEDTMDAFVSMGGDNDGGGCVDAKQLIKIIKEDFEMTIDIEKLIDEIDEDGSGEIEYEEFKTLLG